MALISIGAIIKYKIQMCIRDRLKTDIDDTNRNNLLPIINDLETTINVINSDVSDVYKRQDIDISAISHITYGNIPPEADKRICQFSYTKNT